MRLLAPLAGLAFVATAAFPQGGARSVFIHSAAKPGGGAPTIATYLAGQIAKGLMSQFPCVDQMDDEGARALLNLERERQLLGVDTGDAALQAIAGALGANYLVYVNATTLPNGQTVVSAKVIDLRTARPVANRIAPPAAGDNALDAAESVAQSLMQDLAAVFKGQCQPHWTGTFSIAFEQKSGSSKKSFDRGGAEAINITTNRAQSTRLLNLIEGILQPMSLGSEDLHRPKARVTHKFQYHDELTSSASFSQLCRGGGSHYVSANRKESDITEETGQNATEETVYIGVDPGRGTFEISSQFPAITTQSRHESNLTPASCTGQAQNKQEVSTSEGSPLSEAYRAANSLSINGKIDPANPDYLTGSKVSGDLENGQTTIRWNLRLVKPKGRK